MNIKNVRETVSKIKSQLFKNSNSYSIGMLKSHFRGSGLQFKEHRVYTHGDDVRFIDWRMLAKTAHPYIKTFEEERNVEIAVIIDIKPSMFYGYNKISKLQAAIEICCLLYLLSQETADFVHAVLMADEVYDLPRASGEKGVVSLISQLEKMNIYHNEQINSSYLFEGDRRKKVFSSIMQHLSKNREVVILSDFRQDFEQENLSKLMLRKNVHPFQILSPVDEMESFPFGLGVVDRGFVEANAVSSLNTMGHEGKSHLKKYVKKLNVKDRYLEQFIRDML